jgi:DnaJ-class molecular chaperone
VRYTPIRQAPARATHHGLDTLMDNVKGPNIKKRPKCKNCEGKGLLKKGDKVVKCQRCGGTGVR